MKQIKRTHIIIVVIVMSLLAVGGSVWWFSATPVTNDSPAVTENATSAMPNQPEQQYDPNVDANGNIVTPNDVDNMRQKLLDAGLPADQWAPSDIKKIIVKSSTQGMDPIAYAKDNFHGESN